MISRRRSPVFARWVLLCALACGIVAMHHVPAPNGDSMASPAAVAPGAPGPAVTAPVVTVAPAMSGGVCSMLHLCLAVLFAVALVLLLVVVSLWARRDVPVPSRRVRAGVARPPPGRAVLARQCVLRI